MLAADKEWLRDMCKRSRLAHKLGAEGQFTEAERRRWLNLFNAHKDEYMEVLKEFFKLEEG